MFNRTMQSLGETRSAIRELYEYGRARKREIGEENVFDFSIGNPNVPAPACVEEAALRCFREIPPETLHAYTSAAGLDEVRRAVAAHLSVRSGIECSERFVYMTCGASASLAIALSAILNAGEEVIVPAPYFPEYRIFTEQAGGKLVPVPVKRDFHLDPDAVARAVTEKTKAVLVNSPNNPTGAVYTQEEMRALGAALREKSASRGAPIWLLADEPYREICYGVPPVSPFTVYENTLILYSFSKSLSLAGERIGYIALSPQCADAEALFSAICGAGRSHGYVCAPALFQRVAASCLGRSADIERYRANRDLLYGALADMGYRCAVPEGAFYLFAEALEPDAEAFCRRAQARELLLVPSDSFGVKGYVRISYCVARETIERSLPAFRALIGEYRK